MEEDLLVTPNLANSLKCPECNNIFTSLFRQSIHRKQKNIPIALFLGHKISKYIFRKDVLLNLIRLQFLGCGVKVLLIGKLAHE